MVREARSWREIPLWNDVADEEWNDWKWQLRHRIATLDELRQVVRLSDDEERAVAGSEHLFRFGVTPHYATMIDPDDPACPIRLQAIPHSAELAIADFESSDPLHEDLHNPAPGIIHRYPDRVLFLMTHECALYCRYCTRRRIVGDMQGSSTAMLDAAVEYVRATPAVRDVLLSGGDPLAVNDARLEYVISRLRAIEHVEIIRIGSRMPVVMPQRITPELVAMLRRYHPIWFNTHFNHPTELAHPDARAAMERIADAGIPTGNQTVLLKGVNDCPVVMKKLMHELVKVRCRPYYLYNCDHSEGLSHFRTPVSKGLEILESLWGHTSGYAIPTFVVDAPGGGGKIPLLPEYLLSRDEGRLFLRNFEGNVSVYNERKNMEGNDDEGNYCTLCDSGHFR